MTKFIDRTKEVPVPQKETRFDWALDRDLSRNKAGMQPSHFDYVEFVGHDVYYGDVFKAWDDGEENNFTLIFGEKGDEFNS